MLQIKSLQKEKQSSELTSLSGVKVPSSGCSVSEDVLLLLPGGGGEDLEWVCMEKVHRSTSSLN